jgi:hypothetical protein
MRAWVLMFSTEVAGLAEMVKLAIKDPEVGSFVKGALVYDDGAVYEITLCEIVARWLNRCESFDTSLEIFYYTPWR